MKSAIYTKTYTKKDSADRVMAEDKQVADKLAESQGRYHRLFEYGNDPIFIIDPANYMIVDVNRKACRMLKYPREKLLTLAVSAIHPAEMPKFRKFSKMVLGRGSGWTDELTCRTRTGSTIPAEISASMLDINGRPHLIAFVRDISARKKLEEALKESDKMKSEFVSVASHQLRTPLSTMKLYLEMLAKEQTGTLNAQQHEYINDIEQSNERMIELVSELLNVSRLEAGTLEMKPVRIQVEDFIQSIINEIKASDSGENCSIVFQKTAKNFPKIYADAMILRQVISNLIVNAVRYSPAKFCRVLVKIERCDDACLFSVRDNGIGISKKDQEKIFTKFFRTDHAKKLRADGSGLGLYMAKIIVKMAGGEIWFKSKAGKGTVFYVKIPLKQ